MLRLFIPKLGYFYLGNNLKKKKYIYLAIICAFFQAIPLLSQAPDGIFTDMKILPLNDTLILNRAYSNWWFGACGGVNFNVSFNDLKIPEYTNIPIGNGNLSIDYNNGYGSGFFLGLFGEYLPKNKNWGLGLKLLLPDIRYITAETGIGKDTLKTSYTTKTNFSDFVLSPYFRYNFPIKGLYAFAGLNLEFNLADNITQKKDFINSGQIDHYKNINLPVESFRYGLNIGAGYDIFIADINQKVRSQLSPYFSFQLDSKEISAFNSNRTPFVVKLGVSVKFEVDDIKYDTLFYNPSYIEEPKSLATMRNERGIEFELSNELGQVNILAAREIPISEEVATEKNISVEEEAKITPNKSEILANNIEPSETKNAKIKEEEPLSKVKIELKRPKTLTYGSSSSSSLNKEAKVYLDALAGYLKKNSKITCIIIGHSDNQGSTEQNMKRSQARASEVVKYLMSKGISRNRLLDRGMGALAPIASNETAEGRKRNRRVEIKVVK